MRQAIIWNNADPIHWRIYAALGGDGLISHVISYHYIWYNNDAVSFQVWISKTGSGDK